MSTVKKSTSTKSTVQHLITFHNLKFQFFIKSIVLYLITFHCVNFQAYNVDCATNDDHAAHAGHDDHSDLVIQVYLIFDNTCCV